MAFLPPERSAMDIRSGIASNGDNYLMATKTAAKARTAKPRAAKPRVAKPASDKGSETTIRSPRAQSTKRGSTKRVTASKPRASGKKAVAQELTSQDYRSYAAATLRGNADDGQSIFINEGNPTIIGWMSGVHGAIVQADIISKLPSRKTEPVENELQEDGGEISDKIDTFEPKTEVNAETANAVPAAVRVMGFFVTDAEVSEWLEKR
jgi:hypothetical protein